MKGKQETKPDIFIQNDNLPVVAIDSARISSRKDSLHYIQLSTMVPEGIKEQFRMMIPKANLEKIITTLCTGSGYYPSEKTNKTKMETGEKTEKNK